MKYARFAVVTTAAVAALAAAPAGAEDFPLWVGSTQVTSANAGNILGDGTARFDGTASGGTLFLSNARITEAIAYTGTDRAGIYSGAGFDLTISLSGSNRVECAGGSSNDYCVYAQKTLAITGGGTLVAENDGEWGCAIGADGGLRIDGATVTATSGGGSALWWAGNTLAISNATVTATSTGGSGIKCGGFNGHIDIADSVVNAAGVNGLALRGSGTLSVFGASVVTTVTYDYERGSSLKVGALVLGDGLAITEPAGGAFDESQRCVVDPATGADAMRVVIAAAPVAVYPLWVGGVQVCETNQNDILGDGTARFAGSASGGTLSLSNAVITNAVEYTSDYTAGIYAGSGFDLMISLDGSNRVANAKELGESIHAAGNLSLGGAGALTVESRGNGICAERTLRIDGTTVAASGANGLYNYGNIVLTNATVSATGVWNGIYAKGAAMFAGESRVDATATRNDAYAVFANGGITVGYGLNLVKPDGGGLEQFGHYFVDAGGNGVQHVLLDSSVAYDLWVGGVQVCSANEADILGNGTARFEGTALGGTLTLSGAVITNAVAFDGMVATVCIYADAGFDLTISLDGSNRVENAAATGRGIRTKGNLSFCGEGSLTVKGGLSTDGIYTDGNLRIEGATVTASALVGFVSQRNIVLTNATVTATGVPNGIYAIGAITFAGESRVEATASDGSAVLANCGISMENGLGVALPAGGGVSGTTIMDAGGNAAAHALVARLYTVTVTNGSPTNLLAAAGLPIDITADPPAAGQAFVQWTSDVGVDFANAFAAETTFTMPATNVTVTAIFADIEIASISNQVYTGAAVEPELAVSCGGSQLVAGTDYDVSYANNTNAGTATATVTMRSPRTGSASKTFEITRRSVTFTGQSETKAYTSSEIVITNVVVGNLVAGHAHNVSFSAGGTDVGTHTGTITDKDDVRITDGGTDVTGNYDITVVNGALTIEQDADLAFEVFLEDGTFTYDGEGHALQTNATCTAASGATAVEYSKDGGTWTNELSALTATNVADSCAILVRATNPNYANIATNSASLTITRAANAWITEPAMAGWTVGATPATPNKGRAKFGTATVAYGKAGGAAGAFGATRPSAAGSYTATFTVPETANYGGLTKTVAFTIKPKPTYTVTFDANGGKGGATAKKTAGAALKAPAVTRAGYKLKGWSPAVPAAMPAANVTYRAVWTPVTYTVRFDANGGTLPKGKSMAAQTYTTGKAKKLLGNAFMRDGYVFIGWSKRKNGPVAYKNGQKVKNLAKAGKSVTLYAAWAKAEYKVVFDASGGRGKMGTQTFAYGKAQKLYANKFTRKGYVFGGWAIRDPLATIPKVAYKDGQAVKNLSADGRTVRLYAVWKRR